MFRRDGFGSGELTARNALIPLDDLKFAGCQAGVKIGADLGMGNLPFRDEGRRGSAHVHPRQPRARSSCRGKRCGR